ncbi:MAG: quinone-dependent dihydroorotate dehydrogenase [Gammaproteobacteria bacterium]
MSIFYPALRALLFQLPPETAHRAALGSLRMLCRTLPSRLLFGAIPRVPRRVMGIDFPNPVGLAAGLDKNGDFLQALACLGFGFVEIGTVTPRAQPGNPLPRLFRLPQAHAMINRMGFNNNGLEYLLGKVQRADFSGILGINIGKNRDTGMDRAVDDYLLGLRAVYRHADYVAVNISSPNTPGLRDLQFGAALEQLLAALKAAQAQLARQHGRYVPLAIKVSPDLDDGEIDQIAAALLRHGMDALIATNTTASRQGVEGLPHAAEAGGLSGAPLCDQATRVVGQFHARLGAQIPIIAAGGIMSGADACAKIAAGASLVQLYTGLVYRGPALIREVAEALARRDPQA